MDSFNPYKNPMISIIQSLFPFYKWVNWGWRKVICLNQRANKWCSQCCNPSNLFQDIKCYYMSFPQKVVLEGLLASVIFYPDTWFSHIATFQYKILRVSKTPLIFHTCQLVISQSSSSVVSFFLRSTTDHAEHRVLCFYAHLGHFGFETCLLNKLVTLSSNGIDHNKIIPLIKALRFQPPTEQMEWLSTWIVSDHPGLDCSSSTCGMCNLKQLTHTSEFYSPHL